MRLPQIPGKENILYELLWRRNCNLSNSKTQYAQIIEHLALRIVHCNQFLQPGYHQTRGYRERNVWPEGWRNTPNIVYMPYSWEWCQQYQYGLQTAPGASLLHLMCSQVPCKFFVRNLSCHIIVDTEKDKRKQHTMCYDVFCGISRRALLFRHLLI